MIGSRELQILRYLVRHPTWHYAECIAESGLGPRWLVLRALCRLERHGLAERREDAAPPDEDSIPPWLFRATLIRRPEAPLAMEAGAI